jgi:hypothetical protein
MSLVWDLLLKEFLNFPSLSFVNSVLAKTLDII